MWELPTVLPLQAGAGGGLWFVVEDGGHLAAFNPIDFPAGLFSICG